MEAHGPDLWFSPPARTDGHDHTGILDLGILARAQARPPLPRNPRLGGVHSEERLQSNLKWSFALHGAIFLVIILRSLVFPGEPKQYRPALRVDLVGLPDILKKDLSKISPSLPPVESAPTEEPSKTTPAKSMEVEKADPNEMVLHKKEAVSERNRKRLEQLAREEKADRERERKMKAALSRMKSLARIRSQVAGQDASQEAGILIKGNQISKGTSLSGDAAETAELSYYDLVKSQLQQAWELPVWLSRQNLSAKVEISIDGHGIVRTLRFIKPSGNPQFDEAVKRTIAQSQPFPKPPKDQADSLLVHGISLGFPL
jgi:colicin import membrane protein